MEIWQIVAIPVVSALTGLITTGVVMALGGLGVVQSLTRRLLLVEERIEDTDTRITREVKRRAADAALEARKTDPKEQALEHLARGQATTSRRPSIVGRG